MPKILQNITNYSPNDCIISQNPEIYTSAVPTFRAEFKHVVAYKQEHLKDPSLSCTDVQV